MRAAARRRAHYQPGDLIVFSMETPHTGLANRSDRYFRLSIDIRGMCSSGNIPTVGTIAAVDRNAIVIDADNGMQQTFRIDDDTFARISRGLKTGMPSGRDEIPVMLKVGASVYVAADHGTATFIRPQH